MCGCQKAALSTKCGRNARMCNSRSVTQEERNSSMSDRSGPNRLRFPAVQDLCYHSVQTRSGAHPSLYPVGMGLKAEGVLSGKAELYHHSPIYLHSLVLNSLSTETTSNIPIEAAEVSTCVADLC
jgi:hypothetical protein